MRLLVPVTFWQTGPGDFARGRNSGAKGLRKTQPVADWLCFYLDGNKGRQAVVMGDSQTEVLPLVLEKEDWKVAHAHPQWLSSTSFPRRRVKWRAKWKKRSKHTCPRNMGRNRRVRKRNPTMSKHECDNDHPWGSRQRGGLPNRWLPFWVADANVDSRKTVQSPSKPRDSSTIFQKSGCSCSFLWGLLLVLFLQNQRKSFLEYASLWDPEVYGRPQTQQKFENTSLSRLFPTSAEEGRIQEKACENENLDWMMENWGKMGIVGRKFLATKKNCYFRLPPRELPVVHTLCVGKLCWPQTRASNSQGEQIDLALQSPSGTCPGLCFSLPDCLLPASSARWSNQDHGLMAPPGHPGRSRPFSASPYVSTTLI